MPAIANPRIPELLRRFAAFAHRGGRLPGRLEENTLENFSSAYSKGLRHFETDVHLTSDGHLVAFHDSQLDRVSDGSGAIADCSLAQLKQLSIGDSGRICSLSELFDTFPDVFINIDIKDTRAVDPLARYLRDAELAHRVCVGSFSFRNISRFRRIAGQEFATSASWPTVIWLVALPWLAGTLRWLPEPCVALQIPPSFTLAGRKFSVIHSGLIDAAHKLGLVIHAWTINEEHQMRHLVSLGVDGLVSDELDTLISVTETME